MYGTLHGLPAFCEMAFGPHLRAEPWSPEHTLHKMRTSNERCWDGQGRMGDMAVGVLGPAGSAERWPRGRALDNTNDDVRLLEGEDAEIVLGDVMGAVETIEWAGYVGVRDATTTSLKPPPPPPTASTITASPPSLLLPPWQEMVELRYGMRPEVWGRGYAPEAARAAMAWAVAARGVRRFIAETERANVRSGAVLRRMGFVEHVVEREGEWRNEWWGEESQVEWARVVGVDTVVSE